MKEFSKFQNLISAFDPTKKYVLAVSGGSDSMAMLGMFCLFGQGLNFSVVTVDHKLRKQSKADAEFVESFCKQHNVPCQIFEVDVAKHSKQHKLSIETSARLLRYQIFESLNCDLVVLAHNACDNAESILMHMSRGSGLKGVCGMSEVQNGYFRPLLQFEKQQLTQFCNYNNIPFCIDQTNSDIKYTRNFVRNQIVAKLLQANSNAIANINRFAQNVQADEQFLNSLADISTVVFEKNSAKIPFELLNQPQPIAFRVIQKVFARLGVHCDIEKVHFDSIVSLKNSFGGKKISLPFDFIAVNDYNGITFFRQGEEQGTSKDFCCKFALGKTQTPFGMLVVQKASKAEFEKNNGQNVQLSNSFAEQFVNRQDAFNTTKKLFFDLDKIPADAVVRTMQQGDTFSKFGGGTKKLNRYLIDKKIPQRVRENLLLVCSANKVLIVCGVEICDDVKVDSNSQNIALVVQDKE